MSILTTEIEHIDADAVEKAAQAAGVEMEPTPRTIRIIQVGLGALGWERDCKWWGVFLGWGVGRTSGGQWVVICRGCR